MDRSKALLDHPRLLTLAAVVVVVAALYFARDLLIPLSLASLLSFVLAPVATKLSRWIGRVASVVVVVLLACCALGSVGYFVVVQVNDLAIQVPTYRDNILEKIQSLRGGALQKATEAVQDIGVQLQRQDAAPANANGDRPREAVQIATPPASPLMGMVTAFVPLLGPLGTGGIVILLMTFLLLGRQSLWDRLISLMGRDTAGVTTQALEDASRQVSRFLLMQTLINGIHGIAVALGLWLLQVPNPVLWGCWALCCGSFRTSALSLLLPCPSSCRWRCSTAGRSRCSSSRSSSSSSS